MGIFVSIIDANKLFMIEYDICPFAILLFPFLRLESIKKQLKSLHKYMSASILKAT